MFSYHRDTGLCTFAIRTNTYYNIWHTNINITVTAAATVILRQKHTIIITMKVKTINKITTIIAFTDN